MKRMKHYKKGIALLLVLCTLFCTLQCGQLADAASDYDVAEGSYWEFTKITCAQDLKDLGFNTTKNPKEWRIMVIYGDPGTGDSTRQSFAGFAKNKQLKYLYTSLYNYSIRGYSVVGSPYEDFKTGADKVYTSSVNGLWQPRYINETDGNLSFLLQSGSDYLRVDGSRFMFMSRPTEYFTLRFARDNSSLNYSGIMDCAKLVFMKAEAMTVDENGMTPKYYQNSDSTNNNVWIWFGQQKQGINPNEKGNKASEYSGTQGWKFTKITCMEDLVNMGFSDADTNSEGYKTHSVWPSTRDTANWRVMIVTAELKSSGDDNSKSFEEYAAENKLCYLKDSPQSTYWDTGNLSGNSEYERFLSGDSVVYTSSADDLPTLNLLTTQNNTGNVSNWEWKGLNLSIWSNKHSKWARIKGGKKDHGKLVTDSHPGGFYFCFRKDNEKNKQYYLGQTGDCCTIINDVYGEYCYATDSRFCTESHRLEDEQYNLNLNRMFYYWVWVGHKESGNASNFSQKKEWEFTKVTCSQDLKDLGYTDKYGDHGVTGQLDYENWRIMIVAADPDVKSDASAVTNNKSFETYAAADELCYVVDSPQDNYWNTKKLSVNSDYAQFKTGQDVIYTDSADDLPSVGCNARVDNKTEDSSWRWNNALEFFLRSNTKSHWLRILNEGNIIGTTDCGSGIFFCFAADNPTLSADYHNIKDCCKLICNFHSTCFYVKDHKFWESGDRYTGNAAGKGQQQDNFWIWVGHKRSNVTTTYTIESEEVFTPTGVTTIPETTNILIESGGVLNITDALYLAGTIKNYGTIVINRYAELVMNCNNKDGLIECIGGDIVIMDGGVLNMEKKCVSSSKGIITMKNATLSCNGTLKTKLPSGETAGVFFRLQGNNTVAFTSTAKFDAFSTDKSKYMQASGINRENFPV